MDDCRGRGAAEVRAVGLHQVTVGILLTQLITGDVARLHVSIDHDAGWRSGYNEVRRIKCWMPHALSLAALSGGLPVRIDRDGAADSVWETRGLATWGIDASQRVGSRKRSGADQSDHRDKANRTRSPAPFGDEDHHLRPSLSCLWCLGTSVGVGSGTASSPYFSSPSFSSPHSLMTCCWTGSTTAIITTGGCTTVSGEVVGRFCGGQCMLMEGVRRRFELRLSWPCCALSVASSLSAPSCARSAPGHTGCGGTGHGTRRMGEGAFGEVEAGQVAVLSSSGMTRVAVAARRR